MSNLLAETKNILENNSKKFEEIIWIGGNDFFTKENFETILDVDYDSGFGGQEIATNLKIVGDSWWLERHEYDGSEWWEFKEMPKEPKIYKAVFRVEGDSSWDSLEEINNKEDY